MSHKRLAVREENLTVARIAPYDMSQDCYKTRCSSDARIEGQASVC